MANITNIFSSVTGGFQGSNALVDNSSVFYLDNGKNAAFADMEFSGIEGTSLAPSTPLLGIEVLISGGGYIQPGEGAGFGRFDAELYNITDSSYSSTITTTSFIPENPYQPGTTLSIGGPTEKWGTTWIYSDITNEDFKLHLDNPIEVNVLIALGGNYVYIKIYYDDTPSSGVVNINSGMIQLTSGLITL